MSEIYNICVMLVITRVRACGERLQRQYRPFKMLAWLAVMAGQFGDLCFLSAAIGSWP